MKKIVLLTLQIVMGVLSYSYDDQVAMPVKLTTKSGVSLELVKPGDNFNFGKILILSGAKTRSSPVSLVAKTAGRFSSVTIKVPKTLRLIGLKSKTNTIDAKFNFTGGSVVDRTTDWELSQTVTAGKDNFVDLIGEITIPATLPINDIYSENLVVNAVFK